MNEGGNFVSPQDVRRQYYYPPPNQPHQTNVRQTPMEAHGGGGNPRVAQTYYGSSSTMSAMSTASEFTEPMLQSRRLSGADMPPTERIHYLQQLQSQLDDSIIELSTRTARTKQYLETLDGWEKRLEEIYKICDSVQPNLEQYLKDVHNKKLAQRKEKLHSILREGVSSLVEEHEKKFRKRYQRVQKKARRLEQKERNKCCERCDPRSEDERNAVLTSRTAQLEDEIVQNSVNTAKQLKNFRSGNGNNNVDQPQENVPPETSNHASDTGSYTGEDSDSTSASDQRRGKARRRLHKPNGVYSSQSNERSNKP